jgi:hypothetical protein
MKQTIRYIPLLLLAVLLGLPLSGQSAKKVRAKGILSTTVHEYFLEEGMDEPLVESIEKFNEEGDVIEIQEFNKRGEVKKWEKYAYDEEGRKVEEVFLDARGRVERTEKTIYKDGLKSEIHYFNQRNKLYKKKVYVYEYRH